jgi:four helix bundle protein
LRDQCDCQDLSMATFKSFTEMDIWQKARELSNAIFQLTQTGTFSRDFALKDQINRSSGSVMDNIAEGFERSGKNEFINFLTYSKGSCGEMMSQLYRAVDRRHISGEVFEKLKGEAEQLKRMLTGFITYLGSTDLRGYKFKVRE